MDAGHLLQSGNHAGKSRRQAKKENRMESLYMNIWVYRRITAEEKRVGRQRKKDSGTEPFFSLLFLNFPVDTLAEP